MKSARMMKAPLQWLRIMLFWLAGTLAVAGGKGVPKPAWQSSPFSSMPEYQAILAELARDAVRPSRISGGGLGQKSALAARLEASETAEVLLWETELWQLEMTKSPWQLSLTNKQTGTAWRLAPAGSHPSSIWWMDVRGQPPETALGLQAVEAVQRQDHCWKMRGKLTDGIEPVTLELEVLTPNIIRLSIEAPQCGETAGLGMSFIGPGPFFGLGERFVQARLDGLKTTLRPEDMPGGAWQPGHNWTYIPVPLLFSPGGLGLYLDTAWPTTFDLSEAKQQQFSLRVAGPSTDCYFLAGAEPKAILSAYTRVTGRPPVPPPWAFGVWIDSRQGKHFVLHDAHRLRQLGIPVSAIWVHDFMDHETNLGFPLWTSGFWGAPRQLTAELHQLGYKVLAYRSSYVRSLLAPYLLDNPVFEEGVRNGFFVRQSDGQPAGPTFEPVLTGNIDFTKPAAVDWWEKMVRRSLTEYDFDGWMEDFGEWIKDDHRFDVGKNGQQMANLYPLLYHMITYRIARQCKSDFVGFARSGSAGSQANTCAIWGGDQLPDWSMDNGLPAAVTAGITAGLCGFSTWGPDILSRGTSKELWIRWVQFGALSPIMRDHVWEKPKFSVDLWFDCETLDTFRRYARLHVSLFPYFYTYAHEAAATGVPIIRHLLLEWPEDPEVWNAEHQYLLGDKILVAPVITEGALTRRLYVPKGEWVNYWTGEILAGGRYLDIPAPLQQIPLLVRAGSVIPSADPSIETLAHDLALHKNLSLGKFRTLDNCLTWRVFSAPDAAMDRFMLYDGTRVTAEQDLLRIQVKGESSPVIRQYELILPAPQAPLEVTLSEQQLEKLDDTGYRARKQGWWRNPSQGTLHVLFTQANFMIHVKRR